MTIVVLGAGSIGAFVGGSLLASGTPVRLIGRATMHERIARHGLRVSDLKGWDASIDADRVPYATTAEALADARLIVVAVKSADTGTAAAHIARHASPHAVVASFQNGIGNLATLRSALPGRRVLGAMVPFNVARLPDGRLHRGTSGELLVEADDAWSAWSEAFAAARLPFEQRADFAAVQWGKLLLNLNNAVNALCGLPLRDELLQHDYRLVLAALVDEALQVLEIAGIVPAQIGGSPPARMPGLLRLPDAEYANLAKATVRMDPQARSSMWDDLEAGRPTEVDELNGAVVRLAVAHRASAPVNARICTLVHEAERGGDRHLSGAALREALGVPAASAPSASQAA